MSISGKDAGVSIKIKFETFEDLAVFMISRATTINPLVSIMCKNNKCYSIINIDSNIIIFESPAPDQKEKQQCRYYYISDDGEIVCASNPQPGRVNLALVKLAELKIEPLKNISLEL